ncbi:MAG: SIS domain-containing protein [Candidatus Liptonbacteria bacterium]
MISQSLQRHLAVANAVLGNLIPDIEEGAKILLNAVRADKTLFTCGNGGSAADSQHLSGEWLCKYKDDRKPLRAMALTADTSTLTATANDYGYDEVFARQLKALGEAGDVLVAFTTSGQSKNILRAISQAKQNGMTVVVMTGGKGKDLKDKKDLADLAIVVPSEETARIQEMHELIIHLWSEFVDGELLGHA